MIPTLIDDLHFSHSSKTLNIKVLIKVTLVEVENQKFLDIEAVKTLQVIEDKAQKMR